MNNKYKEDLIRSNILKHIDVTEGEWDIFFGLVEFKTFKKGEYLLKYGEVCNFHGFINKGFLRTFFLDQKGNVVNLVFHTEDWWFGDIGSYVTLTPSKLNTIAMENTEAFILSSESLEILFEKIPKFERFFRILNQRTNAALMNRYIDDLTIPAKERYYKFMQARTNILNRVSLQHIASFLGMTKEYLSKIRSEKL